MDEQMFRRGQGQIESALEYKLHPLMMRAPDTGCLRGCHDGSQLSVRSTQYFSTVHSIELSLSSSRSLQSSVALAESADLGGLWRSVQLLLVTLFYTNPIDLKTDDLEQWRVPTQRTVDHCFVLQCFRPTSTFTATSHNDGVI